MRDYKSRSGAKGRKPSRHGNKARRKGNESLLPQGFTPYLPPAPQRGDGQRGRLAVLGSAWLRPWRLVFAGAMGWLLAGLIIAGVAMWRGPLQEVTVSGNRTLSAEVLLKAGRLTAGLPMHRVDPYEIARRISALPRVYSADVRRLYPGRLAIRVRERRAHLRVALPDGRFATVDADDIVLSVSSAADEQGGSARGLPLIRGIKTPAVAGRPLSDAALERGRAAVEALARLGFSALERIVVDSGDPFLLSVRLPGRQRLVIPHDVLVPALHTYWTVVQRDPEVFDGKAVLDFSALDPRGGGRILIRR